MTRTAKLYGSALYDLAVEEQCTAELLAELNVLRESFRQEPDFVYLLATPSLSKEERCGILDSGFRGKLHPYVLNFLKLLTEKGYIRLFRECCGCYREAYNLDHGILEVRAVTAVALNESQRARLTAKLAGVTGKKICLIERVDPGCLGGVRLDFDGKRLDDTVANQLASIGALLKNTVL